MDPRHILPAAGTYLGSYPHPRIAKAFGLEVGMVYAVSAWLDTDCSEMRLSVHDKNWLDKFWAWEQHRPTEMEQMVEHLCYARKHFLEQKTGHRDMNGEIIEGTRPSVFAEIINLDAYRARRV